MDTVMWTDIPHRPGYEISTDGRVRNSDTDEILTPRKIGRTWFQPINKQTEISIPKVMIQEWLGLPVAHGRDIVFKDGNTDNLHVTNLSVREPVKKREVHHVPIRGDNGQFIRWDHVVIEEAL